MRRPKLEAAGPGYTIAKVELPDIGLVLQVRYSAAVPARVRRQLEDGPISQMLIALYPSQLRGRPLRMMPTQLVKWLQDRYERGVAGKGYAALARELNDVAWAYFISSVLPHCGESIPPELVRPQPLWGERGLRWGDGTVWGQGTAIDPVDIRRLVPQTRWDDALGFARRSGDPSQAQNRPPLVTADAVRDALTHRPR